MLTRIRNFILNVLFFGILFAAIVLWFGSRQTAVVPANAALLINPVGTIVEYPSLPDPLQGLIGASIPRQVALQSILKAIEHGAQDPDIEVVILNLDQLEWVAPANAHRIGIALEQFKAAGKAVAAYGHYYTQPQYHIASYADALYLHPMGQVILQGYGTFSFYINELLNKLQVNVHVFRAGEFKSAVEPFTRNDMSSQARLAAETLYENLWSNLLKDISANRNIDVEALRNYTNRLSEAVVSTNGDAARAALENHLVDELLPGDQAKSRLAQDVGLNAEGDINAIDFQSYLRARGIDPYAEIDGAGNPTIAVIIVEGMIMTDGRGADVAGADEIRELIRQARVDDNIEALVVRIDSPGGSQFASEIVRQELELVQLSGKPVVSSMGATAASGGYWIAATSDAIVAERETITGSIGIFSVAPTLENSLETVGVHTDGVGTTPITLGLNSFTGINEEMSQILQARVEHGYEQFLNLVARGRDLPVAVVRESAEGRVWSGEVAQELGLIDVIGGLDTAIAEAARLAEADRWNVRHLSPPVDPRSLLMAELFGPATLFPAAAELPRALLEAPATVLLTQLKDPFNLFTLCLECVPFQ